MPSRLVTLTLILIDIIIVSTAPFIALFIRFEGSVNPAYLQLVFSYLPEIVFVRLLCFYAFGLYRRLWRYASISELIAIVGAVTFGTILLTAYLMAAGANFPRSFHVLTWLLNIVFIGASRLFVRVAAYCRNLQRGHLTRTLIVGAGDAGATIAREINQRYYKTSKLIGFIDDDPYKQKKMLFGAPVLGSREDIAKIVQQHSINEIIIAMPSVDGSTIREMIHSCKQLGCNIKILPGLYELIDGKVTIQQLRDVDVEDLLRRQPVTLDIDQISSYLTGKRVLVTGAGGSIGSEISRQVARLNPHMIVLLGKGENSIYEIDRELRDNFANLSITPVIADVRDQERIHTIFSKYRPQVVFHAAAHKHVPLMEAEPQEAVNNNIFGTKCIAEAADRFNAEKFVMISTDKAVNPTSVMGATKRAAELIIQNLNKVSSTKYTAVRFGNVLGSRGSVIPLFKRQIANGGPITITHPDMVRYFMTIPEASQLVLQAGAMTQGGEVYVLDMGQPVKIYDMACDLIQLSGLEPGKDIEIKFTGLRPGEKLFEELLTAEEGTTSTKHEKIFRANLREKDEKELQVALHALQRSTTPTDTIAILEALLPTYRNARIKHCPSNTDKQVQKTEEISEKNSTFPNPAAVTYSA